MMSKRVISAVIVLSIVLSVLLSTAAFAGDAPLQNGVVNNPDPEDRLNLRARPDYNSESLGKYYNGVRVSILSYSDNWAMVEIGSENGCARGYMDTAFIAVGEKAANVVPATPKYINYNKNLTLYAGQSENGDAIYINSAAGMAVELLGFSDQWWHVRVNGSTGFIRHNPENFEQTSGKYYDGYTTAVVNNPDPEDRLNLRVQPRPYSNGRGKYYNGCIVAVLEVQKDWAHVKIGNLIGWMNCDFLKMNTAEGVPSAMPTLTISNSSGTGCNLREQQSVASDSLGLYPNGTRVQVMGISTNWYHVAVDGKIGFMASNKFNTDLEYSMDKNKTAISAGKWKEPSGNYPVAEWTIRLNEATACVNNPDPEDRLNLRTEPDERSTSLGKYYNGVYVIDEGHPVGEWREVTVGTLHGYMKAEFLAITGETTSMPQSVMPVMTISNPNSSSTKLLETQSPSAQSAGSYPNGTNVVLMGFNGRYGHVIIDGRMGFIPLEYLR